MIRRGAAVNQLSPPIHPRSNALSSSYNPDQHFQHLPSYSTHRLDVNPSRMTVTNIQKDSSVIPVHSHETKFTLSQNDHHHGEYAQQRIQRIQRQQHQVHPQSTNTPMIHVVNDLLSSNMEHFSTLNHDQNEPKRYLKLPRNTCDPPSTTHHSDSNYQQHLHSFPNSLMSSSILLSKFRKIHTPKSSSSSFTPLILSQNSVDTKQKYHYPMLKTDHLAITIHPPTGMDIADMKVHPLLPKGRIGSHDNKEVILNNGNTLPISLEKLSLLRSRDKEGNVTNLEKIMSTQAIASCSSKKTQRTSLLELQLPLVIPPTSSSSNQSSTASTTMVHRTTTNNSSSSTRAFIPPEMVSGHIPPSSSSLYRTQPLTFQQPTAMKSMQSVMKVNTASISPSLTPSQEQLPQQQQLVAGRTRKLSLTPSSSSSSSSSSTPPTSNMLFTMFIPPQQQQQPSSSATHWLKNECLSNVVIHSTRNPCKFFEYKPGNGKKLQKTQSRTQSAELGHVVDNRNKIMPSTSSSILNSNKIEKQKKMKTALNGHAKTALCQTVMMMNPQTSRLTSQQNHSKVPSHALSTPDSTTTTSNTSTSSCCSPKLSFDCSDSSMMTTMIATPVANASPVSWSSPSHLESQSCAQMMPIEPMPSPPMIVNASGSAKSSTAVSPKLPPVSTLQTPKTFRKAISMHDILN
nr:unnamed protein product [Naegleria fowleri]